MRLECWIVHGVALKTKDIVRTKSFVSQWNLLLFLVCLHTFVLMLRYLEKKWSAFWPRHMIYFMLICFIGLLFLRSTLDSLWWSPCQLTQCWFLTHDVSSWSSSTLRAHNYGLVLTLSFMVSNRLTLGTPQRVGHRCIKLNAHVFCLYRIWDPRGMKKM